MFFILVIAVALGIVLAPVLRLALRLLGLLVIVGMIMTMMGQ